MGFLVRSSHLTPLFPPGRAQLQSERYRPRLGLRSFADKPSPSGEAVASTESGAEFGQIVFDFCDKVREMGDISFLKLSTPLIVLSFLQNGIECFLRRQRGNRHRALSAALCCEGLGTCYSAFDTRR